MKILFTTLILLTGIVTNNLLAQPWIYDFGTATGSFTDPSSTSGFLPDPVSGSDQVRVGNAGGGFVLSGGSDSELKITASNTFNDGEINKFSVYDYTPGTSFSIGFNIRFECDASDNGTGHFFIGNGNYFTDNVRWPNSVFTGIRWRKEAGSSFLFTMILNANSSDYEDINENFSLNTEYYVEMFGNNTGSPINYDYNGTRTLSAYSYDLWIDGSITSVNNRLKSSYATIGNGVSIDSYMILAENSLNNALDVIVDDFTYSNQLGVTLANLKVFLQAPYSVSGLMRTTLKTNNLIPLNSNLAYSTAVYGYTASTVTSIPNSDIVDWVLVELRTGTASGTKVATRAAFLKSDGKIVDVDGTSPVQFAGLAGGNYYVVVKHRNHLAIMSATAIPLSGSSALYDFSTSQLKAYGTNPMKDLGGGVLGMISGETNNSGIITAADKSIVNSFNLNTGYYIADINFSGIVTAADKTNINSNKLKQTFVP